MKKKKDILLYDKDVEEIRAIALAVGTEKLSEETLSKAMLISTNGRKVLADKLVIKERFLKKPDFTKVKELKDDPEKEWPESLFESEKSEFDDLFKSLDDEDDQSETELSEQNRIELVDMDILSEKLIEIQGKRYFVSGLLANTEEEFREIMRNAKINVRDNFPEYVHQIEDIFNLIEIQYIQNYHFSGEYRPTPIFIFSAGNNNDIELLDYVKTLLACDIEFFNLDTEWDTELTKVFENKSPLLSVFYLTNLMVKNDFFDKLLFYYETGLTNKIENEDSPSLYDGLFSERKYVTKIALEQIVKQNIVIFLIKIPEGVMNIETMSFEEISSSLQNYYQRKFLETTYEPTNHMRLLQLVKKFNSVVFRGLRYIDAEKIIKKHLIILGVDVSKIQKNKLSVLTNLIILLGGGLKSSSLINATNYFFHKAEINPLTLNDFSFDINCHLNHLADILRVDEMGNNNTIEEFQLVFSELEKSNKQISYSIFTDYKTNSIKITDFREYINPTERNAYLQERPAIRFSDVIGLREIKKRFRAIGEYYQNPDLFNQLEIVPSNRILLTGGPGTGKTLVTKAFAGEMGIPFFYVSASELTGQKYAGYGGSLLREIFRVAKSYKPCILFFDELDTFGNRENMGGDSVGFDAKGIINTLLVELDGINSENDIIVVGATNRPQDIDPALTRPKRFGTILDTDDFTPQDRKQLIISKLKPEMCKDSYNELLKIITERMNNDFTPAIIEEVINEAKLLAINSKRSKLNSKDINEAIDNLVLGNKINEVDPGLKNTMAYHQSGHALLHKILFNEKEIEKLSVSIYQNSIGIMRVKEDDSLVKQYPIDELIKIIIIQLGGPVCEEMKFGSWGLIAEDDWEFISLLSSKIIGNIAIGESLKPILEYYLSPNALTENNVILIEKLINFCYKIAKQIIEENRIDIELLAKKLIENGELTGQQIDNILENVAADSRNLFEEFKNHISS